MTQSAGLGQDVAIVDVLDRLLASGVVVTGDIVLAIADINLVQISLQALLTSIAPAAQADR